LVIRAKIQPQTITPNTLPREQKYLAQPVLRFGVVLTGIWLLLTDKASLTVVGAGVFAYSAILVIIGKFWKQG